MNPTSNEPNLAAITQSLDRLYRLVESSHFEEEEERVVLLQQLKDLNDEVTEGFENVGLPESFHEALQHTEAYAISRLGDDSGGEDDMEISWHDLRVTIGKMIDTWEAKYPSLGAAFMNIMSMLSKLGI